MEQQQPVIKKIRLSRPYVVHPETKQIYAAYSILVTLPDGIRKSFDSEEHANAYLEKRAFNEDNLKAEIPSGYEEALRLNVPDLPPPVEKVKVEPDFFDVIVTSYGEKKVAIIKALRTMTGEGLRECKAMVDNLPCKVREQISKDEAEAAVAELVAAGASAELA